MLRQFAAIWLLFFSAISWMSFAYNYNRIGFVLVAIALIGLIGKLFICVATVDYLLSCIVNRFLLVIAFFLAITPVALILRLCRRDQLLLRPDPNQTTFWVDLTKSQARKGGESIQ